MAGDSSAPQSLSPASLVAARLDRLPATWTIWKFIILLSLGFFFELYDLLYSGYVAPGLVKSGIFALTTSALFGFTGVAAFIAALFAGLFVGTLGCGFLADKFGRRAIFTWSLLFYSAANLIMAFQSTPGGLNFWRFMAGVGIGVETVTIGAYLSELVPKHVRGRAFACSQAVGFSAVPIVAFLSYLLVPRIWLALEGWRWVVIIGVHGALFVWFIRRALPESPRWLAQHGRIAEADRVTSEIEASVERDLGRPLPPLAAVEPLPPHYSFHHIWIPPYRRRTLMLAAFNILQTVGFYGFANWVPTLLLKQGIAVTATLLYSSIIAVAAPVGPLIGIFVGDKVERKSAIVFTAGAIVVLGLAFSQVSAPALLIAIGVGLTLANNGMSYSFHAYQAELFPTSIRASAVGFVYSWSRFSAIFTSFFIAAVLRRFATTGVFVFIAAAMLVALAVVAVFGPRTRDLALEKISG